MLDPGCARPNKKILSEREQPEIETSSHRRDRADLGNEIEQREYNQVDMERILILNQRTKLVAERVMKLLKATGPFQKTIIFCEDIDHAERMRNAIVNAAGQLARDNSKYVMRITGDSVEGKAELDNFIDPESKYPVIATTSEKPPTKQLRRWPSAPPVSKTPPPVLPTTELRSR